MDLKDALCFLGVAGILAEFVLVAEFLTQIDAIASHFGSYFVENVGYGLIPALLLLLDERFPLDVLTGLLCLVFHLERSQVQTEFGLIEMVALRIQLPNEGHTFR